MSKEYPRCKACGCEVKLFGYVDGDDLYCDDCATPALQECRICQQCRKPMIDGMTNLDYFYCHKECFEAEMAEVFPDGWRKNPSWDEGEYGGYYDYLEPETGAWEDTGIFYTTWY